MTKIYKLLFLLILVTCNSIINAQVSGYSFTSNTGTYTPITGGTNLPSTVTSFLDDNNSVLSNIGFTFTFNGTSYTQFGFNANGFVTLGAVSLSSNTSLSSGTSNNVVAAMNNDLIGRGSVLINRTSGSPIVTVTGGDINLVNIGDAVTGTGLVTGSTVLSKTGTTLTLSANATSSGTGSHLRYAGPDFGIRYETIGSSPNRKLVVQWTGFQRYTTTAAYGELYNFQIILNETTNIINTIYNILGPTSTTATTFQIGLRGLSSSDFNNRTTTTDWTATTAGGTNTATVTLSNTVFPPSGYTFTWTAPFCTAPTALNASNVAQTTATIGWTASGSAESYDWEIRTTGACGSGSPVQFGNTTSSSVNLTGLTANTMYTYCVRSACAGPTNSGWASDIFTTTLQTPATLPYTDDFTTNNFTFVNGTQTNKWAYGSATGNSANSIYVSNDGGTTNAYTTSSTSVVHAFRDIAIPASPGAAEFKFDWKGVGESTFDYMRVWLVPTSFTPIAGTPIISGSGRIQVATYFNLQSSWQTYTNATLNVSSFAGQTMRLVYEWKNDGSLGSQPPAAVDNISLLIPACANPTATAATSVTSSTAYANWTPTTGNFIIEYGPTVTFGTPGTGATAGNVNNFVVTATNVGTIQLTSLSPNTGYSYVVRQDCTGSSNGYSLNSNTITFTTLALPPANDDCAGALVIPPSGPFPYLTTVVDNTGATNTNDPTNTCQANANAGVWYSFTPSQSGSYTLSLCQSDAPLSTISDNVLSIFTSSNGCAGPFTELICDDDGCTNLAFQAYANTNLTASTTYYILAYGYGTNRGNIQLYVSGPPINDECAGSINLTPTSGVFTDPGPQSLFGSTESSDAASCGLSGSPQDIWYVLTSDNDGNMNEKLVLTVTPGNSTADLALALYGGTCGALVELNCVNAGGDGVPETITYTETGFRGNDLETRDNTVYYLRVIDYYGESSPFTISATGSALPVTLVSFDAKAASARSVVLNWTVVDELNITQYIIESSSDGKHWSPIGSVKAAQTPAYSFRDENPSQGINYYRLQMVEANGSAAHSPIRQVIFSADRQVMLAPNPTSGQIYITGLEKVTQSAQISIYNEFGLKVWSGKLSGTELATSGIDLVRLVPGTYVIRVITDGSSNLLRFVKQ